jgi:hypothetical protein
MPEFPEQAPAAEVDHDDFLDRFDRDDGVHWFRLWPSVQRDLFAEAVGRWRAGQDAIAHLHGLERAAAVQADSYRRHLAASRELLATYGWVAFGTHAGASPCPPLTFSDQLDEGGLPFFERVRQ